MENNMYYNLKQNLYILIREYGYSHNGCRPTYIICDVFTYNCLLSYLKEEIYYTYNMMPIYQGIKICVIRNMDLKEEKIRLWAVGKEADWREFNEFS